MAAATAAVKAAATEELSELKLKLQGQEMFDELQCCKLFVEFLLLCPNRFALEHHSTMCLCNLYRQSSTAHLRETKVPRDHLLGLTPHARWDLTCS